MPECLIENFYCIIWMFAYCFLLPSGIVSVAILGFSTLLKIMCNIRYIRYIFRCVQLHAIERIDEQEQKLLVCPSQCSY